MTLPKLNGFTGCMPPGRHVVTEAEIESRFVLDPVWAASVTRIAIWESWQDARDLIRSVATVPAVWISGSFVTDKVDPDDIDLTFIISWESYLSATLDAKKVITSFTDRIHTGPTRTRSAHEIPRVDSFAIMWTPLEDLQPESRPDDAAYCRARGYWDDWWSRRRVTPKGTLPLSRMDALPQRGYLEVILDGYS